MRVVQVDQFLARCQAKGIEREVSLFMLPEGLVESGDYVLVHVGYAIQKISSEDAQQTWALLDEVLSEETHHG